MAGCIPLIQRLAWQSSVLIMVSHAVHQTQRLATRSDRPLVFNAWFPFDTTTSPVFELVYISQVTSCSTVQGAVEIARARGHGPASDPSVREGTLRAYREGGDRRNI
jgi:hypothetical protein